MPRPLPPRKPLPPRNTGLQQESLGCGTWLIILTIAVLSGVAAYWVYNRNRHGPGDEPPAVRPAGAATTSAPATRRPPVLPSVGLSTTAPTSRPRPLPKIAAPVFIMVGTDAGKRPWFDWAAKEFKNTAEGAGVIVAVVPSTAADAAARLPTVDAGMHAWAPANALYRSRFVANWQALRPGKPGPILREQSVALSPMAFVVWDSRRELLGRRYGPIDFQYLAAALAEPNGWADIAVRPTWGPLKVGVPDPERGEDGAAALALLAHAAAGDRMVAATEVGTGPGWEKTFDRFAQPARARSGPMLIAQMSNGGPAAYDCVLVEERMALEPLAKVGKQWPSERLTLAYPRFNLWNDHPFYVLDVPWSSPEQRRAADAFGAFLLSEPAQRKAMELGYRPANHEVPATGDGSSLDRFRAFGWEPEVPGEFVPVPSIQLIDAAMERWKAVRTGS